MNKLSKIEMLFIRACKELEPHKRLKSLHKRFYLSTNTEETDCLIISVLAGICDDFLPINVSKVMEKLSDKSYWYLSGNDTPTYNERCMNTLMSHIRNININKLPDDMVWGIKWRRNK